MAAFVEAAYQWALLYFSVSLRLCGERAVKSRLLSDGNDSSSGHSYVRGEKPTRAGLLPVRKFLAVSV